MHAELAPAVHQTPFQMKHAILAVACASALAICPKLSAQSLVEMTVNIGGTAKKVTIRLDETTAPKTSANFKKLVTEGFYNGLTFHRVISDYIAQVGDPLTKDDTQRALWGTGGPGYTVPAELGGKHVPGALATARLGDTVNPTKASSGSQFYICLAEIEALDGEYTVFGNVTEGLDVIQEIASVPVDEANRPDARVEIQSMKLIAKEEIEEAPDDNLTLTKPEPIMVPTPLTAELATGASVAQDDPPMAPTPLSQDFDTSAVAAADPAPASEDDGEFARPTSMLGSNPTPAPSTGSGMGLEALPPESDLGGFERPTSMLGSVDSSPEPSYQRPTRIDTESIGQQATSLIGTAASALKTANEDGSTTTVVPTGPTTIATAGNPSTAAATPVDPNAPPQATPVVMPPKAPEKKELPETINGKPTKKGPINSFLRRFW